MPKVLTNGKISIGVYNLPDRKRPTLCVGEGNSLIVCAVFHNESAADLFMDKVAAIFQLEGGEAE